MFARLKCITMMLLLVCLAASAFGQCSVRTDKDDYHPGQVAYITGSGWQPGEVVDLFLQRSCGCEPTAWSAYADGDGNISTTYQVVDSDAGVAFLLTATGESSGCQASTIFSDSAPFKLTVTVSCAGAAGAGFSIDYINNGGHSASHTAATKTFTLDPGSNYTISNIDPMVNGATYVGPASISGTAGGNGESATVTLQYQCGAVLELLCPADTSIQCGSSSDPSITGNPTPGGGTAPYNVSHSDTFAAGNCGNTGVITRHWTVTDANNQSASCDQMISVVDTTAPVISAPPGPIEVQCASQIPTAGTLAATDNCSGPLTANPSDGSPVGDFPCNYTITRTWTVSDACGNAATPVTQLITVHDTTAPVLSGAPTVAEITVECDSVPTPPNVTANDNCAGSVVVNYSEVRTNGNCANNYTLTRTWSAVDGCTNMAQASQIIHVQDTTPPVISNQPGSLDKPAQCESEVAGLLAPETAISASDNCGTPTVTHQDSRNTGKGCVSDPLIVTRTFTATDACGLTATFTQTITVMDTTPPVAPSAPADANYQCKGEVPAPGMLTAHDNCTGDITVAGVDSDNGGSGCPSSPLVITRTWTFTDACGNASKASQKITVVDDIAPEKPTPPGDANYKCVSQVPAAGSLTAHDNCSGDIVAAGVDTDNAGKGCPNDPLIITRTWTFTDNCGNSSSVSQKITVVDDIAPTFVGTCPLPDVTVTAPAGQCAASVTVPTPAAIDNCGSVVVNGVRSDNADMNAPFPVCTTTITWTATDACGNTATCIQKVNVQANVSVAYTGDAFVFTAGPTIAAAPIALQAHVSTDAIPSCKPLTDLVVRFDIYTSGQTPAYVGSVSAPVNANGDAGALYTVGVGSYEVRCVIAASNCWAGAETSGNIATVDYGSTEKRATGGGWINSLYSGNGKANFGFTVGFNKNGTLKGNAVYMLHSVASNGIVPPGGTGVVPGNYNWKVKDNSWVNGTLAFYANKNLGNGSKVDSARFIGKCTIQQIDPVTGATVWSIGNCTFVVDVFDGDQYNPVRKDQYSIKVYLDTAQTVLWWGSSPNMQPLGGSGPGGGNVTIFSK